MPERPESLDLIAKLVSFDTVSERSNLPLIEFARELLAASGIEVRLVPDETGTKANLLASVGPLDRPGVLLSGHTDVVPVEAEGWESDPFAAAERDGNLYGRGSADMKGWIGAVLTLLPELARRSPRIPVHLALSHDEEVGCVGVRRLLPELARLPAAPALCLVGEPTGMRVGVAHKGKSGWRVTLRGRACHSGLAPHGVNAIEHAAELVGFIADLARRRREAGPFRQEFEIPHTTLQTGTIRGGSGLNVVPAECQFEFEIRAVPGDDPETPLAEIRDFAASQLEPRMRARAEEAAVRFEPLAAYPGLDASTRREVVEFVEQLAGAPGVTALPFGSEAGLLHQATGAPTLVCGPGHIGDAHRPNEFVALDQIARCERFLGNLFDHVCENESLATPRDRHGAGAPAQPPPPRGPARP